MSGAIDGHSSHRKMHHGGKHHRGEGAKKRHRDAQHNGNGHQHDDKNQAASKAAAKNEGASDGIVVTKEDIAEFLGEVGTSDNGEAGTVADDVPPWDAPHSGSPGSKKALAPLLPAQERQADLKDLRFFEGLYNIKNHSSQSEGGNKESRSETEMKPMSPAQIRREARMAKLRADAEIELTLGEIHRREQGISVDYLTERKTTLDRQRWWRQGSPLHKSTRSGGIFRPPDDLHTGAYCATARGIAARDSLTPTRRSLQSLGQYYHSSRHSWTHSAAVPSSPSSGSFIRPIYC